MKNLVLYSFLLITLFSCQDEVENLQPQGENLGQLWLNVKEAKDPDTKLLAIDKLFVEAQAAGNDEFIGKSYFSKARVYDRKSQYDLSLKHYILADECFQKAENMLLRAHVFSNIGNILMTQNSYDPAIDYFNKAASMYSEETDLKFLIKAKVNLGLIYTYKPNPDFTKAKEIFGQALAYAPSLESKQPYFNRLHNLIGAMYYEAGEYDKAIAEYKKSMEYIGGDDMKLAIAKNNIGESYLGKGSLEIAEEWINDALTIAEGNDAKATCLITQGQLLIGQGEYKKALMLLHQSLKSSESNNSLSNEEVNKALSLANQSLIKLQGTNNEIQQDIIIDIAAKEHSLYEGKEAIIKQLSSEYARNVLDNHVKANKLQGTIGQLQRELSDTVGEKTSYVVMLCLMVLATIGLYVIFRKASKKYIVIKGKYQKSQAFDLELLDRIKRSGFIDNFSEKG